MVGGAISGILFDGQSEQPDDTTTTIEIEITADRMGRSIKVLKFIVFLVLFYFNGVPSRSKTYAFRNNDIPSFNPSFTIYSCPPFYTGHTDRS